MIEGYWASVVIFTVFVSMLGLLKLISRKFHIPSTRKAIHTGGGLLACTFPWIGAWNYVLPAPILACAVLFGMRFASKRSMKRKAADGTLADTDYVLYDTGHMGSYGEVVFPVVMAFLVWTTRLDKFTFVTAMAVLALADTTAALIGSKYGKITISSFGEDKKTRLGSLLFFIVSYILVEVNGMVLTDYSWEKCFALAFIVSIAATIFEMTGSSGMDNFLVPVSVAFLLSVLGTKAYDGIMIRYAYMSILFVAFYLLYITKLISLFSYFQFAMMISLCLLVRLWPAAVCVVFVFLMLTYEQKHNFNLHVGIVKPFVVCNTCTLGILEIYQGGILSEKMAELLIIIGTVFLVPYTLLFIGHFVTDPLEPLSSELLHNICIRDKNGVHKHHE